MGPVNITEDRVVQGRVVVRAAWPMRSVSSMRPESIRFLVVVPLLCVGVFWAGCRRGGSTTGEGAKPGPRPNIVIYLVDTLRPDRLGLFGHDRETSPRLESFAEDGVVFEQTYSPSGWTKPAVASVLTGLNPPRHGAITRTNQLPPQITLLSERLSAYGYQAAAMVCNPNVTGTWGFDQGFEYFYDVGSDTQETRADEINATVFQHMSAYPATPFFYYVHTLDPHAPYDPPPPYRQMFTDEPAPFRGPFKLTPETPEPRLRHAWDKYDAEIAFNDEQFGLLMDRLKADGLYKGALIIFIADHGEELLDHEGGGHGHTLYEELVCVPMVVKFPGNAYAGQRVKARAALIDIVPTILSYLRVDVPDETEGIDLLPLVRGAGAEFWSRPIFFDLDLERRDGTLNVSKAVLEGDFKYYEIVSPRPKRMLFNIARDPREKLNLAESEPAKAKEMAVMLAAYSASTSGGVHLKLVNKGDHLDRVMQGALKSAGRFVRLRKYQCEEGDWVEVLPDGKTLTFRVLLVNHPGVPKSKVKWVTDEDHFAFEVDPPGAEVTVERLVLNNSEDLSLFVGPDRRCAESVPYAFLSGDESLRVPDPGALFREGGEPLRDVPLGGYLVIVPSVQRLNVETMDEELRARLEALGYVGGEDEGEDEG